MSLIMKRRMQESQRKNGLNNTELSQSSCMKPVESQFNYNAQNCQANMNMALPMEKNNYIASMPIQHHHHQQQQQQHKERPMNLETIQQIKRAEGDQRQTNVTQLGKITDVINPLPSGWSHSGNVREGDVKVECSETSSTNIMENSDDVVTEEGGAYYDTPIYIDPMTYQQQHCNSINTATNAATMIAPNLAQQRRCSNFNCMNCKRAKS